MVLSFVRKQLQIGTLDRNGRNVIASEHFTHVDERLCSGKGGQMCESNRNSKVAVVLLLAVSLYLSGCWCGFCLCKPQGNAQQGAVLFVSGDGTGSSCQSCHCSDGSGGCRLLAPNIQAIGYDMIDDRVRNTAVQHPGSEFDFTDQDIADIEAFLATFEQE